MPKGWILLELKPARTKFTLKKLQNMNKQRTKYKAVDDEEIAGAQFCFIVNIYLPFKFWSALNLIFFFLTIEYSQSRRHSGWIKQIFIWILETFIVFIRYSL